MFDLSKSFSQLCLVIHGEKIFFFLYEHLKWFENAKKSEKNCSKSFPLFFDRAERRELKSRLWLFFSPLLFPPQKKEGRRKIE